MRTVHHLKPQWQRYVEVLAGLFPTSLSYGPGFRFGRWSGARDRRWPPSFYELGRSINVPCATNRFSSTASIPKLNPCSGMSLLAGSFFCVGHGWPGCAVILSPDHPVVGGSLADLSPKVHSASLSSSSYAMSGGSAA